MLLLILSPLQQLWQHPPAWGHQSHLRPLQLLLLGLGLLLLLGPGLLLWGLLRWPVAAAAGAAAECVVLLLRDRCRLHQLRNSKHRSTDWDTQRKGRLGKTEPCHSQRAK